MENLSQQIFSISIEYTSNDLIPGNHSRFI